MTADVAVDGGRITEVGQVDGRGARELDADGLVVAPGWVDIHTHYDGQVTWDPERHAVELARRDDGRDGQLRRRLRAGAPRRRGLPDRADGGRRGHPRHRAARGHRLGVGDASPSTSTRSTRRRAPSTSPPRCPHAALRAYVMGERAHERDADADEIAEMSRARRGGAAGRRLRLQHHPHDPAPLASTASCPAPTRPPDELLAIGDAIGARRPRRVPARVRPPGGAGDRALAGRARASAPAPPSPTRSPRRATRPTPGATRSRRRSSDQAAGRNIIPQVSCRPDRHAVRAAVVAPPVHHPPDVPRDRRPAARRAGGAAARSPRCAPRSWPRSPDTDNPIARGLMQRWEQIFPLGDPPDYEPPRSASVAAVAEREGRSPQEVVLDWMLERDGDGVPVRAAGELRRPRPRGAARDDDAAPTRCSACPTAARTAG